jgi:hypothetical protein
VLVHHLPCLHCNLRRHAKISTKAQVFRLTQEQLAKPSVGPTHYLLALVVSFVHRHLKNV